MATTYVMSPITLMIQFFQNIGVLPLAGGQVFTYTAGTTTPVATYTDSTGTTQNANPIILSSAGRLQAASGAPVACWVPQGTQHKMVVEDVGGNFIIAIDNLTGINDLSSFLTTLANPASGSGVDLVANAVKSYFNFANMRAAATPVLAASQTLIVAVECQSVENDIRGGLFLWDATLTNADDNFNFINPTANLLAGTPGRYRRIAQPYLPNFDSANPISQGGNVNGAFTGALTGCSASVPVACVYYLLGLDVVAGTGCLCVLLIGPATGTSNATTMTLTGLPSGIGPQDNTQTFPVILEDNGAVAVGQMQVTLNQTTITFGKVPGANGGFTATGTKGIPYMIAVIFQVS